MCNDTFFKLVKYQRINGKHLNSRRYDMNQMQLYTMYYTKY